MNNSLKTFKFYNLIKEVWTVLGCWFGWVILPSQIPIWIISLNDSLNVLEWFNTTAGLCLISFNLVLYYSTHDA